jgi:Uma2 family endonuclease
MVTRIEPALTVDDLEIMPDDGSRYEIIEGELYVSRAPGLTHQEVLGNIYYFIKDFLNKNSIGRVLFTPGVIFNDYNGVIPDLIFISDERRDEILSNERLMGAPELMIEIVSPGAENNRRDRIVKRQTYGKFGVQEYWVVDPENRSIEIYNLRAQSLELTATLTEGDQLTSAVLPGFQCAVTNIFRV